MWLIVVPPVARAFVVTTTSVPPQPSSDRARYSELQKSEVTVEESGLCPQDLGPGINEVRQRCFVNPLSHDIEKRSLCQDRLGTNDVIARPRKKTTREVTSFIMICRAAGRTLVSRMGAQRIVRLGTGSPGCNDAVSCYSRCLLQVLAAATVHACSSVYCTSSSIVRVYRLASLYGIVIVCRMHSILQLSTHIRYINGIF